METTLSIYREAEAYVNQIVFAEWPNIALRQTANERNNYVEDLIHCTRKNKAVYADFDRKFYKFPSYLRRQITSKAIGHV
ncbi:MAG TPA: transposase, partial [Nitrospiraceae bacterium]|nr:transposase [Nitrospiraceae bacterium]